MSRTRKGILPAALVCLFLAVLLMVFIPAGAEEAKDLTAECRIELSSKAHGSEKSIIGGNYKTYWESKKSEQPWVILRSEEPIYGLYLCFQKKPETYVIQTEEGKGRWQTIAEGHPMFYHAFYAVDGVRSLRILATDGKNTVMGFNEVFAFGEGELPDWVQRWEEPQEKVDILFLAAHPDDELLFMGGAIADSLLVKKDRVQVVYLTISNTTRRSEGLNGLWTLGMRTYPVFGPFSDVYKTTKVKEAYGLVGGKNKVQGWVTEIFRRFKPEVVVTHDVNGEYGHPQHKMLADACMACWTLAADGETFPESAAAYGAWQVKKLYIHLYGDETNQTQFDWSIAREEYGGLNGDELAQKAYEQHETQKGMGKKFGGKMVYFSVAEYGGKRYPNTKFGLYASTVGDDRLHDDFMENIRGAEEEQ